MFTNYFLKIIQIVCYIIIVLISVHIRHRFVDSIVTEISWVIIQDLYIQESQKEFSGVRLMSRISRTLSKGVITNCRNCYRLNFLPSKKLC